MSECASSGEVWATAAALAALAVAWTMIVVAVLYKRQAAGWQAAYHEALRTTPSAGGVCR